MLNASTEQIMSALLAKLTQPYQFQGTTHSNNIIDGIAPYYFKGLYFGMPISGPGIPANTRINGFPSSSSIQISNAATASATVTVTGTLFKRSDRKLVSFTQCPPEQRPALFLWEPTERYEHLGDGMPPKITLTAMAFIYTYADPALTNPPPISLLNPIKDALLVQLQPDLLTMRQTLGVDSTGQPLCHDCYIEGELIKRDGSLDGNGIAVVPIKVMVPW